MNVVWFERCWTLPPAGRHSMCIDTGWIMHIQTGERQVNNSTINCNMSRQCKHKAAASLLDSSRVLMWQQTDGRTLHHDTRSSSLCVYMCVFVCIWGQCVMADRWLSKCTKYRNPWVPGEAIKCLLSALLCPLQLMNQKQRWRLCPCSASAGPPQPRSGSLLDKLREIGNDSHKHCFSSFFFSCLTLWGVSPGECRMTD